MFEALEDAGLVTAAVNLYVCRGRVRHQITRPAARRFARTMGIVDAVYGPRRYFLGDLFFSDLTGAPRNFGTGIDRHGGAVARWLVTRDGFDFLFLYLYETDAAGHRGGDVMGAVERADNGLALMVEAAGGLEPVPGPVRRDRRRRPLPEPGASRSPTPRRRSTDLRLFRSSRRSDPDRCDVAVAASNRAAMAYLLPGARIGPAGRRRPAGGARAPPTCIAVPRRRLARGAARRRRASASAAARARPTSAATAGTSRATPACSTRPLLPERARAARGRRSSAPPRAT